MNTNNKQSATYRARATVVGLRTRVAAAVTTLSLVPAVAMAQSGGLGGSMLTEVTGIKADVQSILVLLAGVVGLILLWKYLRKAG